MKSVYVGLTSIQKEAWSAAERADNVREKIQALSLAKECYGMKLELLTNATVVDDAIRFVSAYRIRGKKIETETEVISKAEFTNERFNNSYNTTF